MNKLIHVLLLAAAPAIALAAGGHVALEKANIDLTDQASLQSGAKHFMNNCMDCPYPLLTGIHIYHHR
jgi:ubiquinol-cytochrome c reductase cytochrome c1 subunit